MSKPKSFLTLIISLLKFYLSFDIRNLKFRQGITLLLVVVILSAILAISIGVFNIMFGQLIISGELGASFRALYTTDEGIEKLLYRDRIEKSACVGGPKASCETGTSMPTQAGGCYDYRIDKTPPPSDTAIVVTATYPCGGSIRRSVKRSFQVTY